MLLQYCCSALGAWEKLDKSLQSENSDSLIEIDSKEGDLSHVCLIAQKKL